MKKLIALLLLLPVLAPADPEPWMKKENPNEIFVGYRIGKLCELSEEPVSKIVKGVFIRSRIKPLNVPTDVGFLIDLQCGDVAANNQRSLFTLSIELVRLIELNENYYWVRMDEVAISRSFGTMKVMELEDELKHATELALTDYLQANFELGGDDEN